ncbi:MAG: hypothetical protein NZM29_06435 [Nitrospira sp.]|nr:hypothetical protein [Nitrospira sp.]
MAEEGAYGRPIKIITLFERSIFKAGLIRAVAGMVTTLYNEDGIQTVNTALAEGGRPAPMAAPRLSLIFSFNERIHTYRRFRDQPHLAGGRTATLTRKVSVSQHPISLSGRLGWRCRGMAIGCSLIP